MSLVTIILVVDEDFEKVCDIYYCDNNELVKREIPDKKNINRVIRDIEDWITFEDDEIDYNQICLGKSKKVDREEYMHVLTMIYNSIEFNAEDTREYPEMEDADIILNMLAVESSVFDKLRLL
jgi:hypothetical protein